MEEHEHTSNLEFFSEKIELLDHSLSVASKMMNAWKLLLGGLVFSVLWIARIEYAIGDLNKQQQLTDKNVHSIAEIVSQLKTESALNRQSIQDLRGKGSTTKSKDAKSSVASSKKNYEDDAKKRGYYLVEDVAQKISKSELAVTQLCSDGIIQGAVQLIDGDGWRIPLDFQLGCSETAAINEQHDSP